MKNCLCQALPRVNLMYSSPTGHAGPLISIQKWPEFFFTLHSHLSLHFVQAIFEKKFIFWSESLLRVDLKDTRMKELASKSVKLRWGVNLNTTVNLIWCMHHKGCDFHFLHVQTTEEIIDFFSSFFFCLLQNTKDLIPGRKHFFCYLMRVIGLLQFLSPET